MERQHYLWTAANSTVNVSLAADVITRLRDVAAASSTAPEIGGILFGRRTSDDSISIDDFEIFASEHRRGLTFTLSGDDKRRLAHRLRASHQGLEPVGSFRTHRRQGLYMDQYDFELMAELFPALTDVMLLIRPTDWRAGFFVWDEGDINRQKSYAEFPFDAAALPLVATLRPIVENPVPVEATTRSTIQRLPTLFKVALIAATAGLAAVLAFYTHAHHAPDIVIAAAQPPHVAQVNPPVYPGTPQGDDSLEMHIQIPDRPSPFTKSEVPTQHPAPAIPAPPFQPQNAADTPQPATPPQPLPPTFSAAALPLSVSRPVLQPVHPIVVSNVSLEPSQPGVLRRGIHHVPVLNLLARHNYKSGTGFSPARPIREVKPRLPEGLQPDSPVDVKVWIDDTGQVTKAELLSDHVDEEIAEIASNAAYKWTFQPARLSDHPVSSEMVMHFHFVPQQR